MTTLNAYAGLTEQIRDDELEGISGGLRGTNGNDTAPHILAGPGNDQVVRRLFGMGGNDCYRQSEKDS